MDKYWLEAVCLMPVFRWCRNESMRRPGLTCRRASYFKYLSPQSLTQSRAAECAEKAFPAGILERAAVIPSGRLPVELAAMEAVATVWGRCVP